MRMCNNVYLLLLMEVFAFCASLNIEDIYARMDVPNPSNEFDPSNVPHAIQSFFDGLEGTLDSSENSINSVVNEAKEKMENAEGTIVATGDEAADVIKSVASMAETKAQEAEDVIMTNGNRLEDSFGEGMASIQNTSKNVFESAKRGIETGVHSAKNWTSTVSSSITGAAESFWGNVLHTFHVTLLILEVLGGIVAAYFIIKVYRKLRSFVNLIRGIVPHHSNERHRNVEDSRV